MCHSPDRSLDYSVGIFDGNILRADDFLRGQREERAGLHRRVVGDDHDEPAADARQAGDGSGGGCSAPFLIHFVGGENAELKKGGARINEFGDAFARGEPALFMLGVDGFSASALADLGLLFSDFRQQVRNAARVLLIVERVAIDLGFDGGTRQGRLLGTTHGQIQSAARRISARFVGPGFSPAVAKLSQSRL